MSLSWGVGSGGGVKSTTLILLLWTVMIQLWLQDAICCVIQRQRQKGFDLWLTVLKAKEILSSMKLT